MFQFLNQIDHIGSYPTQIQFLQTDLVPKAFNLQLKFQSLEIASSGFSLSVDIFRHASTLLGNACLCSTLFLTKQVLGLWSSSYVNSLE